MKEYSTKAGEIAMIATQQCNKAALIYQKFSKSSSFLRRSLIALVYASQSFSLQPKSTLPNPQILASVLF